jgi:hypothetical protein
MSRRDLVMLADHLLPGPFNRRTSHGDPYDNVEGLAIVLRRQAFPARWTDLSTEFGRHLTQIGRVYAEVLEELDTNWGFLLDFNPYEIPGPTAEF